jgi:hypothetical protein
MMIKLNSFHFTCSNTENFRNSIRASLPRAKSALTLNQPNPKNDPINNTKISFVNALFENCATYQILASIKIRFRFRTNLREKKRSLSSQTPFTNMASIIPKQWSGYHYTVKGIAENPNVASQIYDIVYVYTHYGQNFNLNPSKVQDYVRDIAREVVHANYPPLTKLFGGNKLSRGSREFAQSLIYDPLRGGSEQHTLANAKTYLKHWSKYHNDDVTRDDLVRERFAHLTFAPNSHNNRLGAGQSSSSYA